VGKRGRRKDNLREILDRVLDKGIVVDAWVRVCPLGIGLLTIQAGYTVTSLETALQASPSTPEGAWSDISPPPASQDPPRVVARVDVTPIRTYLRCEQGCTFVRESPMVPKETVAQCPCALDPGRMCTVKVLLALRTPQ
jgi:hypothetical protein